MKSLRAHFGDVIADDVPAFAAPAEKICGQNCGPTLYSRIVGKSKSSTAEQHSQRYGWVRAYPIAIEAMSPLKT